MGVEEGREEGGAGRESREDGMIGRRRGGGGKDRDGGRWGGG